MQAKCAECEAEEREGLAEQDGSEPVEVQRMPAFESGDDGETGTTVQRKAAFFSTAGTPTSSEVSLPFFQPIQTKLTIGRPDDPLEHEADAVADRVILGRSAGSAGGDETRPAQSNGRAALARKEQSSGRAPDSAAPSVEARLASSKGGGTPLASETREHMEQGIGADFDSVRIHTDSEAADLSRSLGAKAFTHGGDIYFGAGNYAPGSTEGQHLLAHELTHTVQQGAAPLGETPIQAKPSPTVNETEPVVRRVLDPDVVDDLIDDEIQSWSVSTQSEEFAEEAFAWRVIAMLDYLADEQTYEDEDDFHDFVDELIDAASLEWPHTAARLGSQHEDALRAYPRAFPLTWGQRVAQELYLQADEEALQERAVDRWQELGELAEGLPELILDKGLPVPYEQALRIESFVLALTHTRLDREHAVREYARANLAYAKAGWIVAFVALWNVIAENVRDSIFDGDLTVDPPDYDAFLADRAAAIQSLLDRMEQAGILRVFEELDEEIADLASIVWVQALGSTLGSLSAAMAFWERGTQLFDAAVVRTDTLVQGQPDLSVPLVGELPVNQRTLLAFQWILDNGYLGAAGEELMAAIRENGWQILLSAIAFIIVQFIPYLNVAVDIAVLIYSGFDAIDALINIKRALESVAQAETTIQLQRRSALLARSLLGEGLRVVMDLIGIATGVRGIGARAARLRSRGVPADEALERAIAGADSRLSGISTGRGFSRWESSLNAETRAVLESNPGLRRLYARLSPMARRLLTRCASLCIPTNPPPTGAQISRLNAITARLGPNLTQADIVRANRLLHLYRFELDTALGFLDKTSASRLRSSVRSVLRGAVRRQQRLQRPERAIPDDTGIFMPPGTTPAIESRILDMVFRFRQSTSLTTQSFHANYAVFKVRINGQIRYIEHANHPGGLHSEILLVRRLNAMDPGLRNTRVLAVFSERPPCFHCQEGLLWLRDRLRPDAGRSHAEFPVYYFVPRDIRRGKGTYLRVTVYGL